MKKLFPRAKALMLGACALTLFCGCGDEFDAEVPSIVDTSGSAYRLYGYGGYKLAYDEKGRLISWNDNGSELTLKDGKYVYSGYDELGDEGLETSEYTFTTNKDGLITKAHIVFKYEGTDSYIEKSEFDLSLSYNGSKQCTGYKGSGKNIEQDDISKETTNIDLNMVFSWQDGNLTKAVFTEIYKFSGTDEGEKYSFTEKGTETDEFEYGSAENPLRQMPYCIAKLVRIDGGEFGPIGLTGLFGAGPANLPVKCTWTEVYEEKEDGEEAYGVTYSNSNTNNINISLNSNGTFASENGTKYYYSPVISGSPEDKAIKAARQLDGFKKLLPRHGRHKFNKRRSAQ